MTDLAAWLLEQVSADEQAAKLMDRVYPGPWEVSDRGWMAKITADGPAFRRVVELEPGVGRPDLPDVWLSEIIAHVARWDPARVLAECAARRAIVELCADLAASGTGAHADLARIILRRLVQPLADRPGFDPAWRLDQHTG